MNREEIQQELNVCTLRPQDASAEARAQLELDAELREWFDKECAADESLGRCLEQVEVPEGLRNRILDSIRAETAEEAVPQATPLRGFTSPSGWLAIAAAITVGLFLMQPWETPPASAQWQTDAVALLDRIETGRASLDAFSGDVAVLKASLTESESPVPSEMPVHVRDIPMLGCKACMVAGQPASVICFRLNENNEAHVVILDSVQPGKDGTPDAPAMGSVGEWNYARWQDEGKTFFLASRAPAEELQKLFAVVRSVFWRRAWI
jgi:hypothetical protein